MRRRTIRKLVAAAGAAAGLGVIAMTLLPDDTAAPEPAAPHAEPVCPPPEAGVVERLTYPAAGLSLMPPRSEGLQIMFVMKGSTAHEAGIQPQGFITHINGRNICGMTRADIDSAMSVSAEKVALTIHNVYKPREQNPEQHALKLENRGPFVGKNAFDEEYSPIGTPQPPAPPTYPDFYTVTTDLAEVFQNKSMEKPYPERLAQGSCVTVMKDPKGGDLAQVWIKILMQPIISQRRFELESTAMAYMKTDNLTVMPDRTDNIAPSCEAKLAL